MLCPRCKANYLLLPHGGDLRAHSRPGSSASHHSHHSGAGATPTNLTVACTCGLRLELAAGAGMGGLAQLQERLAAVYGHHRCVRTSALPSSYVCVCGGGGCDARDGWWWW